MYAYAAATLAEREGRTHAIAHGLHAFEVFRRIGFKWRAARAALLLYRCAGDERHLDSAYDQARDYPRSFLRDDIEAAISVRRNGLERLSSRQRQVLVVGWTHRERDRCTPSRQPQHGEIA